ncbi:MAG: Sbal_3080 family lipoprotein [Desulfuromonas sp.]|nr:Sbal_3080 family lipoprotein [Desulfuromonas sp.]
MKKVLLILALTSISACTSIKVNKLNPSEHKVHHICIENNPKVIVGEFPGVIEKGLQRHGITSEIYDGERPKHCEYYLTYTAMKTWDIGMYLHHAELHLFKEYKKIAYAEYHLNGKGGLALNKWASVDSKMDPIINQLLSGFSPEVVDAYRQSIPDSRTSSDTTEELEKLKMWHSKGLITDEEYSSNKKDFLEK